jgi:hypothetical protein
VPVPSEFDHTASGYSLEHAYWLAHASELAYQDEPAIDKQANAWGFGALRHHQTRFTPPFPLEDTQAYTMASDRMIVVAFRGTEPAQIRDWLADATTPPWPGPATTGYVHYGFAQALESVFPDVKDALAELRTAEQSVWFTGHSLGGALAMLAAARLSLEEPRLRADGVYTYGQPRTCDRLLGAAYNSRFSGRSFRFVNNEDIVPQLPPEPVYTHVESVRHFGADGRLRAPSSLLGGLAQQAATFAGNPFAASTAGIRDHGIRRYIAALRSSLG